MSMFICYGEFNNKYEMTCNYLVSLNIYHQFWILSQVIYTNKRKKIEIILKKRQIFFLKNPCANKTLY